MPDTMPPAADILPTVLRPDQGEMLSVLGAPMLVKCDAARAAVFVGEHTVPPGYGVPPHIHDHEDEVFHILDGELTLDSAAGSSLARPGDTVILPRGGLHGFRNMSDQPVRFLVVAADGQRALAMFRALHRLAEPTPEVVMSTCAAHGVRFA